MKGAVSFITIVFLIFVMIAYLCLLKDTAAETAEFFLKEPLPQWDKEVLLGVLVAIVSPLGLLKDLYALRHTCYIGFTAILILAVSIFQKGFMSVVESEDSPSKGIVAVCMCVF